MPRAITSDENIFRYIFRFINIDKNDESRKHFNQRLPIKLRSLPNFKTHISLSVTVLLEVIQISEWYNEPLRRKYCALSIYTSSIAVNNVCWQIFTCNTTATLKVKYTPDLVCLSRENITLRLADVFHPWYLPAGRFYEWLRTRIVLLRNSWRPRAGKCIACSDDNVKNFSNGATRRRKDKDNFLKVRIYFGRYNVSRELRSTCIFDSSLNGTCF